MIPYSMQVRAATTPMFSGVNSNISVYRWTSAMEHNFREKRVPYSVWVKIAFRFLTRLAM